MAEQTIKTYKTKSFSNEGVKGGNGDLRLKESSNSDGIPAGEMSDFTTPITIVGQKPLKKLSPSGEMPAPVSNTSIKGKSAGMIGANNTNHK